MGKAALEQGLEAELSEHVGYERGAPDATEHPYSRNGHYAKTVISQVGASNRLSTRSGLDVHSDDGGRGVDGGDGMIVSLYAGGITLGDICRHWVTTVGVDVSHETISKVVDWDR